MTFDPGERVHPAFGAAPGGSDPLIVQGALWLLFLPVMAGLWIRETTWPLVVRLGLVLGLAGWNLMIFLPRALMARP